MPLPGKDPSTAPVFSPAPSRPDLPWGVRLFRCLMAPLVITLLVSACSAFEPIEPPKPVAKDFNIDAAKNALSKAKAAESAGNWNQAMELYREAATRWPVYQDAWSGLARAATELGDEQTLALARFFEDRVVESDNMYPRQARMSYVNAVANPPKDIPAVGKWSKRMIAFFEYKDAYGQREAFDKRPKRSMLERYAIYPVAVGSVAAAAVSLNKVFSNLGNGSGSSN